MRCVRWCGRCTTAFERKTRTWIKRGGIFWEPVETYCTVRLLRCAVLAPRPASPELAGVQRLAACCSKARFPGPLAASWRAFSGSQHAARKTLPRRASPKLAGVQRLAACCSKARFTPHVSQVHCGSCARCSPALEPLATVSLRFPEVIYTAGAAAGGFMGVHNCHCP